MRYICRKVRCDSDQVNKLHGVGCQAACRLASLPDNFQGPNSNAVRVADPHRRHALVDVAAVIVAVVPVAAVPGSASRFVVIVAVMKVGCLELVDLPVAGPPMNADSAVAAKVQPHWRVRAQSDFLYRPRFSARSSTKRVGTMSLPRASPSP